MLLIQVSNLVTITNAACRDGKYRKNTQPRRANAKRPHQQESRKVDSTCISRIYVDEFSDGHLEVKYIPFHTGHKLDPGEFKYHTLPESTKELQSVTTQGSAGIGREVQQLKAEYPGDQQPHSTEPDDNTLQARKLQCYKMEAEVLN